MATIDRKGYFRGPDYVRGLALQQNDIHVQNSTTGTLPDFVGGIPGVMHTYSVTFHGTGFGTTSDGRYTGIVTGFDAVDQFGNAWHVTGYSAPLDVVNTAVTMQDFIENLLVPVKWDYEGNKFPDVFIGGSFGDKLVGRGGDDTFEGLDGDDTIMGGRGKDTLHGESGNDTVHGGRGDDTLTGGPGADLIKGGRGNDHISGLTDADQIFGDDGRDMIFGGDAGDVIFGGDGFDSIFGGGGPDEIRGDRGNDLIEGGDEGDTILGGRGNDLLLGQSGADEMEGGRGGDFVDGGDGTDVVMGGRGGDTVQGGASSDFITGGRGDDILAGNIASAVQYDEAPDTFIFEGRFGHDIITDFEINWDGIRFLNIDRRDVKVKDVGSNDVRIEVSHIGKQTIIVQDVAGQFDKHVDIVYG